VTQDVVHLSLRNNPLRKRRFLDSSTGNAIGFRGWRPTELVDHVPSHSWETELEPCITKVGVWDGLVIWRSGEYASHFAPCGLCG